MTLTLFDGPLATKAPHTVNYRLDGPEHRLLFTEFPRRVRALFGQETAVDSTRAMLLHETDHLPQLYVPRDDVRAELLEPAEHTTQCPFKGDAAYWSLRVGDRTAENAVWEYHQPTEEAHWLRGYLRVEFDAMDAWFDEDEEIDGHVRDPYHRVDVRRSNRHVRVVADGEVVADTHRPALLSETGLPNRYYVPLDDVRRGLLEPSATHTVCPYKGRASYHTLDVGGRRIPDAAWSYLEPLKNALKVRDHLCFSGDGVEVHVDGQRIE
ncbi:MAG TPA: DUF427 domain-containing protein [Jiangellaceae bacterium]